MITEMPQFWGHGASSLPRCSSVAWLRLLAGLFLAAFLVHSVNRNASLIPAWLRLFCTALWTRSIKKQVFHNQSLRRARPSPRNCWPNRSDAAFALRVIPGKQLRGDAANVW